MIGRVVLVETSDALPGLLPLSSWRTVVSADPLFARDPERHPAAAHLRLADVSLHRLEPATLDPRGLSLGTPGDPVDRRIAAALVNHAEAAGEVVYLLGPEDRRLTPAVGAEAAPRDVETEVVFFMGLPRGAELLRLVAIEQQLRDPDGGCPWDLEQDHDSLGPYLIEEAHELLDAIASGDDVHLAEELGDVLLQVVFHAQVADDRRAFTIDDVARSIADKLVRRHPHVFGDATADTAAEVQERWDELKQAEQGREGPFDGIPGSLPALMLAAKYRRRAERAGLSRPDAEQASAQRRQAEGTDAGGEIGDALLALVAAANDLGVDPEQALRQAAARFRATAEAQLRSKGAGRDH